MPSPSGTMTGERRDPGSSALERLPSELVRGVVEALKEVTGPQLLRNLASLRLASTKCQEIVETAFSSGLASPAAKITYKYPGEDQGPYFSSFINFVLGRHRPGETTKKLCLDCSWPLTSGDAALRDQLSKLRKLAFPDMAQSSVVVCEDDDLSYALLEALLLLFPAAEEIQLTLPSDIDLRKFHKVISFSSQPRPAFSSQPYLVQKLKVHTTKYALRLSIQEVDFEMYEPEVFSKGARTTNLYDEYHSKYAPFLTELTSSRRDLKTLRLKAPMAALGTIDAQTLVPFKASYKTVNRLVLTPVLPDASTRQDMVVADDFSLRVFPNLRQLDVPAVLIENCMAQAERRNQPPPFPPLLHAILWTSTREEQQHHSSVGVVTSVPR
ncbi:hypothetical protein NOR_06734 [Metarhizium rileyi]|uniref:Uncharacterized protein n=1 Tax=Metarhizium rileyi (strain RCEF 4871) TaxID=1649241 RepID=A0A166ZXL5_METRR|nr:hypothetical protein NOR_06734 [Metarhizium rileyi RCEF 4871]